MPLPESLYEDLKAEAAHSSRSANALAREAIAQWLDMQRRARVHREVLEYAVAMAGTAHDLDITFEAALDRGKLGERLGTLDPKWMREIEEGVKIPLDLQ